MRFKKIEDSKSFIKHLVLFNKSKDKMTDQDFILWLAAILDSNFNKEVKNSAQPSSDATEASTPISKQSAEAYIAFIEKIEKRIHEPNFDLNSELNSVNAKNQEILFSKQTSDFLANERWSAKCKLENRNKTVFNIFEKIYMPAVTLTFGIGLTLFCINLVIGISAALLFGPFFFIPMMGLLILVGLPCIYLANKSQRDELKNVEELQQDIAAMKKDGQPYTSSTSSIASQLKPDASNEKQRTSVNLDEQKITTQSSKATSMFSKMCSKFSSLFCGAKRSAPTKQGEEELELQSLIQTPKL